MRGALRGLHVRKAARVGPHPDPRIRRTGILPGRKPEQHRAQVVRARAVDQRFQVGENEAAFRRFHLLPGDRNRLRVRAQSGQHRPHLRQHRGIVARIVGQRPQHWEGLAIHEQEVAPVAGYQARQVSLRPGRGGKQDEYYGEKYPHPMSPAICRNSPLRRCSGSDWPDSAVVRMWVQVFLCLANAGVDRDFVYREPEFEDVVTCSRSSPGWLNDWLARERCAR